VETIDHDKHVQNIKTADGSFVTVDVPPSAKRFDELKVRNKVSVTYNNTGTRPGLRLLPSCIFLLWVHYLR
jgi:hypothetical protein